MKPRLVIVAADFHKKISEEMIRCAKKAAQKRGMEVIDVVKVSGVFDIHLPLQRALARNDVDCAIVLGSVVQGETSHDEIIAYTTAQKVAELSLKYDKPVGYGISGPRMTVAQARQRAKQFAEKSVETVSRML